MKKHLVVAATIAFAAPVMSEDLYDIKEGLGRLIGYSKACGYEIDNDKVMTYVADKGLDDLANFDSLQTTIRFYEKVGNPSALDCTLALKAGSKIGVIK